MSFKWVNGLTNQWPAFATYHYRRFAIKEGTPHSGWVSKCSRINVKDMFAQERDIVAAANVDTFADMGDRPGEVQAAIGDVGYGEFN